ncbi:MAG: beta-ketoacyl-ACP synthase II [Oscillospiraceae bacterium]|nr:beta-ketoacyl-ACP synthase II [Oscillospiraceae bacterium]
MRVVITGMGVVTPIGNTIEEFASSLENEKLGFTLLGDRVSDQLEVKIAATVEDFDTAKLVNECGVEKKDVRKLSRFTQFAVAAAHDAIADAGTDFTDVDPYRAGVICGVGMGDLGLTISEGAKYNEKGPGKISVFYIPMTITNMAAGTVAMKNQAFKGANFCTTTACASGTHAIGEAFRKIKDGYMDVCIAGGSESCVNEFALGGFNNMHALTRSDDPEHCSTPFDLNRSGFVLGEGCGMLVLESLDHALARGAHIYAEVAGYGATGDGYHMTSPSPTGEAAAAAMTLAIKEAGLEPSDIDYINAHGTSTGLNDKYETTAIKIALGEHARHTAINSTKSMTGHLLGAAGAVEAIATVIQIEKGFIHRTLGYTTPDPECDLDYVTDKKRDVQINAALSNSLGFGGHNACILIKRYNG